MLKANLTSQAIISGVKKLASAVTEIGKASFEGYSQYEQLVGGVETLFKESAGIVQNYAKTAYKTAGLSANEYMSTVTSFSASLLQGLGNDTAAAAEYADMAITDMADNANKMGTSMEAIQNAYQGFAKQNYTMLDNLKLGYGGTKAEMERLLEDAAKIKAANGEMVTYSIDSFADMVDAIHVVQTEMGITGTTAKEAESTIEGSIASMKSAWANLATGMADDTADMGQLTQDFVDSVNIAAGNIIPRIKDIAIGVGTATVEGISYLRESNQAVDVVVTAIEDLAIVAAATGAVVGASMAGGAVKNVAVVFLANAEALSYFTIESGKAAVAEATLNGTFSAGEIVVGLLTGKISLATVAQLAWNKAMNANPIVLVVSACAALGIAAKNAYNSVKDLSEEMAGTPQTAAEAAAKLEELNEQYEYIAQHPEAYKNTWEWSKAYHAVGMAIEQTKGTLATLVDEETAAAVASGELTAQSLQNAETIKAASETYSESVQTIVDDYYKTYQSIYDGLHNMGTAFTDVVTVTETNWADAMSNIAQNTQVLEDMDANMALVSQAAADAGINIDGFKEMLSQMGVANAAGLVAALASELSGVGASSGEAVKTLTELSDATQRYAESGTGFAGNIAVAVSDVSTKLAETLKDYTDTVEGFDQGAEAIEAAINTMEGLISGITSESSAVLTEVETLIEQVEAGLDASAGAQEAGQATMDGLTKGIETGTPGVLGTIDSLASQMKSRLQTSFSSFTLRINAIVNTSGASTASYTGFTGRMAGGVAVVAEESAAYKSGAPKSSGVTINQYIQTPVETPAEVAAATEAYFQQARWAV